jgi:hypothetical protein
MIRRLFRGRKNGANNILGDKFNEKGISHPPQEFLEPVTMNESDVSSESAYSSLQETQTPVVQPVLRRTSGIHAEWEVDKDTQKEMQSSPDKENPQVRPTKARSSLNIKGLMSRIKSRSNARAKMGSVDDDIMSSSPSMGSSVRPVLITVNDGAEDMSKESPVNTPRVTQPTSKVRTGANLVGSQYLGLTQQKPALESTLSSHFLLTSFGVEDDDDSLFASDTASEVTFTTGTSFGTGFTDSTGYSADTFTTTGFSLSTAGTIGTQSVLTELTGNNVNVLTRLYDMSEEEDTSTIPPRIERKKGLANSIADDFAGIFSDVLRGGNDILLCAVDNACNADDESYFDEDESLPTRRGRGSSRSRRR